MMRLDTHSVLLQRAIDAFSSLPGIGPKSALRLALHTLRQDKEYAHVFCQNLLDFVDNIRFCKECHNISDHDVCSICKDPRRDRSTICVVESVREVIAIENTGHFKGVYHVLGGLISPMDGVSPSDLFLNDLPERVAASGAGEVILALSTTMEGDTTNFYIYRMLRDTGVVLTALSRGVSVGDDLEYADELTLGRSIDHRISFEDTLRR